MSITLSWLYSPHIARTTQKMDDMFFWQPGDTKACLSPLQSIIGCDDKGRISILHASLSDFLLDPSRSRQFYLCRESILGDCAALGLRHFLQQELNNGVCPLKVNTSSADLQHVLC